MVTLDQTEITLLALWEHRGTKARVTVKKSNILLSNLSFLSERERERCQVGQTRSEMVDQVPAGSH